MKYAKEFEFLKEHAHMSNTKLAEHFIRKTGASETVNALRKRFAKLRPLLINKGLSGDQGFAVCPSYKDFMKHLEYNSFDTSLNPHIISTDGFIKPIYATTCNTVSGSYDTKVNEHVAEGSGKISIDSKFKRNLKYQVGNKLPILVIGDLHLPFTDEKYRMFNLELVDKYDVGEVVFIGDIVDNHSISYHEHNPNLYSPAEELERAKKAVAEWYDDFPVATVLKGNHDLFDRKIVSAGLPTHVLKSMSEIYNVPGWRFEDLYEKENLLFTHGTKLSRNTIKEFALRKNKSVIAGHLHTLSYVENVTQNIFVSHIGCGIDYSSAAFDYARGTAKDPILSSLVLVYDQIKNKWQPILHTM